MQKATLYESVNMIQLGAMPLPSFLKLHPDAKVAPEELAQLKAYLAPWTPSPSQPGNAPIGNSGKTDAAPVAVPGGNSVPVSLASVQPEPNGFTFDQTFESWKPISTTDRGDNNTFRFILGNEIAVKAAQSGNISPWPDGARLAKIAWQQETGSDGLVHPGKFVQVEMMVKDAAHYKNTEDWGWGRWRGMDLKPYGKDANFVSECTGCHLPVRGNDYVYTLPITEAKVTRDEVVNNRAAAFPPSLPYQPLGWSAITMYVDSKNRTTATLYGNEAAMQAVQSRRATSKSGTGIPAYPSGAVLALVTWAQRDDPHWFGARIPDELRTVEFVQVASAGQTSIYRSFTGPGLSEDHPPAAVAILRSNFLQGLIPAWLP